MQIKQTIAAGFFFVSALSHAAEIRVDGTRSASASMGRTSFRFDITTGGSIVSLKRGEREFVKVDGRTQPLLYVVECFDGTKKTTFTNRDAVETDASVHGSMLTIRNKGHNQLPINVTATIRFDEAADLSYWDIQLDNESDLGILGIEYPHVLTPKSLGDISDDRILLVQQLVLEQLLFEPFYWLQLL